MEDISFAPLFTRKSILLEAPGDENTGGQNNQPANDNRPATTAQNTDFNIDTRDTPALGADKDDTPNTGGDNGQEGGGQAQCRPLWIGEGQGPHPGASVGAQVARRP